MVQAAEVFQLPAPDFRAGHKRTIVTIFGPRPFENMGRDDRIRACYQHCALRYVSSEWMTNQSLCERHVQRVFSRLGFVAGNADNDLIIYRARELFPEYPGAFDLLFWEVGRSTCRHEGPDRAVCPLADLCAHHQVQPGPS